MVVLYYVYCLYYNTIIYNTIMYNSFEDDSDFEDEEFNHLAVIIAFPRQRKTFRPRIDHFTQWRDD